MSSRIAAWSWKYTASLALGHLLMIACTRQLSVPHQQKYYVESTSWIEPKLSLATETPKTAPPPKSDLYTIIDTLLQEQRDWRKAEGITAGYSLQLYKSFSRKEAEEVRAKANIHSTLSTTLSYRQPHYIVWTGFFLQPLQAYEQKRKLESIFSHILIVPRQIRTSSLLPDYKTEEEK